MLFSHASTEDVISVATIDALGVATDLGGRSSTINVSSFPRLRRETGRARRPGGRKGEAAATATTAGATTAGATSPGSGPGPRNDSSGCGQAQSTGAGDDHYCQRFHERPPNRNPRQE